MTQGDARDGDCNRSIQNKKDYHNMTEGCTASSPITVLSRFVWFSISFACAESALVVTVSLSSRLFGTAGSLSVAALYVSYAVGTIFASEAVRFHHSLTLPLILGVSHWY